MSGHDDGRPRNLSTARPSHPTHHPVKHPTATSPTARSAARPVSKVSQRVAVFGQGPIGLSIAMRAVSVGHDVVGFDLDRRTVAALADGRSTIDSLSDRDLAIALGTQRYRPTDLRRDLVGFDVGVIAVSSPDSNDEPHRLTMQVASQLVGRHLRPGCVVICELQGSPGTPERELVATLESESGLRVGRDVHLGRSLESRGPTDGTARDFSRIPEVSGFDAASTSVVVDFYRTLAGELATAGFAAAPEPSTAQPPTAETSTAQAPTPPASTPLRGFPSPQHRSR